MAAFQQQRDEAPWRGQELLEQIADCVRKRNRMALQHLREEIPHAQTWLAIHRFDRRKVNRQLRQYANGNEHGCEFPEEAE